MSLDAMAFASSSSGDWQRVIDATDIVDLIGEQLRLHPKGREFVCICPFHDDHKPSMTVVPSKQIYKCFSCGAGGDAIAFVTNYHGMSKVEALRHLAERAGVELTPWKPERALSRTGGGDAPDDGRFGAGSAGSGAGVSREEIAAANAFAHDFYRTIFNHAEHGRVAREAAERRGISEGSIEDFQIGAAPDRFDGLLTMIERRKLEIGPFLAAGLLKQNERGRVYDAFRNRLMFPIMDQTGRTIAFGGRILDPEDSPKYLNSPESPLFDKSSTLYGIRQGFASIRESKTVIISEGYTDVVACHQAGIRNVVATLGTALTRKHANLIKRVAHTVVLLFDGDEAGQKAAQRAHEVLFREPIDLRVCVLPGGIDPDECLKQEGGRALFEGAVAGATDAMTFRMGRLKDRLRAELAGSAAQTRILEEELRSVAEMGTAELPPIQRQQLIKRLATLTDLPTATIQASLKAEEGRVRSRGRIPERRGETGGFEPDNALDGEAQPTLPEKPLSTAADHVLAMALHWGLERTLHAAEITPDPVDQEKIAENRNNVRDALRFGVYSSGLYTKLALLYCERLGALMGTSGKPADVHSVDDGNATGVPGRVGGSVEHSVEIALVAAIADELSDLPAEEHTAYFHDCLRDAIQKVRARDTTQMHDPALRIAEIQSKGENRRAFPKARR